MTRKQMAEAAGEALEHVRVDMERREQQLGKQAVEAAPTEKGRRKKGK
jgi:hypothetical protein